MQAFNEEMHQPQTVEEEPSIDDVIATVQSEHPDAGIRTTDRARTIRGQAELMAERIHASEAEFLGTYTDRPHIREMTAWFRANPEATVDQTVNAFEGIIRTARANGAVVSNHLSDTARDISWPRGAPDTLNAIEARFNALGTSVIREPNAAGGPHCHIDWGQ